MAFMDDPQFIISQIRHSCVTSDDTGMSEIVIVNEETENEKLLQKKKFGNWDNGDVFDYSNSFDIDVSPMESGIGNSADLRKVHSEKDKKDNKNSETKCRNVSWKDRDGAASDSELSQVFSKKDIVHTDKKDGKPVSKLSQQIEASINQPKNPFAQYGKFDGEGYERTNEVCGFKISFPLPVSKGKQQHAAMDVCLIVVNAQVQDLIGLIMFKYTQQGRKPELKGDVKSYCLLIADELDGEVDFDLPALDSKEMISKFHFKALALSYIKQEEETKETKQSDSNSAEIIVEVCEEKRGSSKFAVNRWDHMNVVMGKMLKKRGLKRTGHEYVLVKKSDPGTSIDLEATLDSMQTLQFQLVKRTSIPTKKDADKDADKDKNRKEIQDQEFFTSAQYKSFKVTLLHRFRATSEVQLGIDSRNIEIHQATQSNQRTFLNRSPKAVTIEMDYVVDSEVIKKSGNHSTFRITYSVNHDFKNYDFECSNTIAGEIVRKIELILNASPKSDSRSEYQKVKDKRTKKS